MRSAAGALALLALTPAGAFGATRYVSPHGAGAGACRAARPCSVAWAVNGGGSRPGDTIVLAGGAYLDQPVDVTRELFIRGPVRGGGRPLFQTSQANASAFVIEPGADGATVSRVVVRTTGAGALPVDLQAAAALDGVSIASTDGACLRASAAGTRLEDTDLTQRAASSEPCLSATASDTLWTGVRVSAPHGDLAALLSGDGSIDDATFVARGTALQLGGAPTVRRVTARGGDRGILLGGASALLTDTVARAGAGGSAIYASGGNDELLNITAWDTAAGADAIHAAAGAALTIKSTIARGAVADVVAEPGASALVDHSIFTTASGVTDNGANIASPPRLIDPARGNFHPAKGSPAIDHGTYELQSGTADRAGLSRLLGRSPDIGAYETRPLGRRLARPPDTTPPVLADVRLGTVAFRPARHGVAFSAAARAASLLHFFVSEKCDLVGIVSRRAPGAPAIGAFVVTESPGFHSRKLSGRLDGRPLPPGAYRLTLVARDEAQNLSPERHLRFRIVR